MGYRWGAGATIYDGAIVVPTMPEVGRWEVIGADYVRRNSRYPNQFEVRIIARKEGETDGPGMPVWVASGWLPYLQVGSIWEGKKLVGDRFEKPTRLDPDLERNQVDLVIGPDSLTDIDPYADRVYRHPDGHECNGYMVPKRKYPMAGLNRRLFRLVGVRVGADPCGLIIPSFVLYHFYFAGISDRLAEALIADEIDRCFDPSKSHFVDRPGGHYFLHQADGICDADCWIIARVAADAENGPARRAFRKVHASLVAAHVNGTPTEPKALFPFYGQTRLRVMGYPLPRDKRDPPGSQQRFLALRILSCSGGFPYQELSIRRVEHEVESDGRPDAGKVPITHIAPSSELTLTHQPPDSTVEAQKVPLTSPREKFGFLRERHLLYRSETRAAELNGHGIHCEKEGSGLASVAPGSSKDSLIQRLHLEAISAQGTHQAAPGQQTGQLEREPVRVCSKGVVNFLNMLSALEAHPGIDEITDIQIHQPFHPVDEKHWFGSLPQLPGQRDWHLIEKPSRTNPKPRARLALVVEIRAGGDYGYLFDIEPRATDKSVGSMMLVLPALGRALPHEALEEIINCMRTIRRGWSDDESNPKILQEVRRVRNLRGLRGARFVSIEHNRQVASAYVSAICTHLMPNSQVASSQT